MNTKTAGIAHAVKWFLLIATVSFSTQGSLDDSLATWHPLIPYMIIGSLFAGFFEAGVTAQFNEESFDSIICCMAKWAFVLATLFVTCYTKDVGVGFVIGSIFTVPFLAMIMGFLEYMTLIKHPTYVAAKMEREAALVQES